MRGHVVDHVQRAQGRPHHRRHGRQAVAVDAFTLSGRNAILTSNPTIPLPPEYPDDKAFFTVTFFFNENPPADDLADAHAAADRPRLVLAVLAPWCARCARRPPRSRVRRSRASSRSSAPPRPARARSASRSRERFDGEVVSCDSTAVYRGFDIGTDKVPPREQAGHSASPDRRRRSDPRSIRRRATRARRRPRSATSPRAAGCRSSSAAPGSTTGR